MESSGHGGLGRFVHITSEYRKWRNDWDSLCNQCGQCCYRRSVAPNGEVIVDYASPCRFLNEETHLCSVFDHRFEECSTCGKVNMYQVLFNPSMPPECAYVKTFRHWEDDDSPEGEESDESDK